MTDRINGGRDIHKEVTDSIIAELKNGLRSWVQVSPTTTIEQNSIPEARYA
jgi:antirestriction protein ArdC